MNINIRGIHIRVRGYEYAGMNINIRGTRVSISGVQWYSYPGYEGMSTRDTRVFISGVFISGVRGYEYLEVYKLYISGYIELAVHNVHTLVASVTNPSTMTPLTSLL